MTQNQIAYHNALELKRHNLASEAETNRHQMISEYLQKVSNQLSHESNVITKEHYERMDAINATHYANQDAYNAAYLEEQRRANQANEAIRAQQNAINAAQIQEVARHNTASEMIESSLAANTITKTQRELSLISPQASYIQAQTDEMKKRASSYSYQNNERLIHQGLMAAQTRSESQQYQLIKERVKTEPYTRFRTGTESARNIMSTIETGNNLVMTWLKALGVFPKQPGTVVFPK